MVSLNTIKNWLKAMAFVSSPNELSWTCTVHGGYAVSVTLDKAVPADSSISYGSKLKVGNKGISNFKRPENFVVLECVVRLLRKGYHPENLELEKTWPSGHGTSGRLDILITRGKGNAKKSFAMIECKQWGGEYSKERGELLKDGGQLFSYAIQEASTEYLTLYASTLDSDGTIKMVAEQVNHGIGGDKSRGKIHRVG